MSTDGLRESGIGYLPQRTDVQKDFPAAVREVVLSGCQARLGRKPFYSREDKKRAEENMEKMGISAFAKRCFRELSGGQQQRVLLARHPVHRPGDLPRHKGRMARPGERR